MNYCLSTADGFVLGICESEQHFPNEITAEEKDNVYSLLLNRPTAQDGFTYKLKADTLEWELVELPEPSDTDEDATIEDYESALTELGVNVNAD